MNIDTEILETIEKMPEYLKQELLHYAKYLMENYNPETYEVRAYEVRADGELLTCEPASVLPMAQPYFLSGVTQAT